MRANARILLDNRATGRAHLRGVGGVDTTTCAPASSALRQQVLDLRQPRVVDAKGQAAVGGHERARQVFDRNQPVGVDKLAGELAPEVAAHYVSTMEGFAHDKTLRFLL